MCEPYHSVVQYPAVNAQGDDVTNLLNAVSGRIRLTQGQKILDWVHYARSGFGHSETINKVPLADRMLPEATRYEGAWWNREFTIDGGYAGHDFDAERALEAAHFYSKQHALGSVITLQDFLRGALSNSAEPEQYLDLIVEKLVKPSVRAVVWDSLKEHLKGDKPNTRHKFNSTFRKHLQFGALLAEALNIAGNRELLVPEWADDDKLWTPDDKPLAIAIE